MNVFRVELRRFASRRLVHVLLIVAVAGIALASTIAFFQSNRPDPGRQEVTQSFGGQAELCPPGKKAHRCELTESSVDSRFLYQDMDDVLMAVSPIWVMLALVAGASFMGAEWHTGNIATTLTWEPRRVHLFVGKTLACAVAMFIAATLLQVVLSLFLAPTAIFRGSTEGLDSEFWSDMASVGLKASLLAVAGGLIGFALASIGRNTGAALGITFAYSAVVESAVRGFKPHWFSWLLTDNAVTFMSGDTTLFGAERSVLAASLTIAAYAIIPLLAGLYLFQRRDVT